MDDFDYKAYEQACDQRREENEAYLAEFEQWLKASGLSDKTIRKHIDNIDFYLNTYLLREDAHGMEEGCLPHSVDDYLGYFFIHKCMWSSPAAIRENATSFKKFYKCMLEHGRISKTAYNDLLATIKANMNEWIAECNDFDNSDDGYGGMPSLGSIDKGVVEAAIEAAIQNLGLSDLLGSVPDDEGDLPTKQETIRELTLVLLYLTSWEEEPIKGSGVKVRRAWKSADWDALNWLREMGLVDGSNKAKSVYLTDNGAQHAKESLVLMGLGHLVSSQDKNGKTSGKGFTLVE